MHMTSMIRSFVPARWPSTLIALLIAGCAIPPQRVDEYESSSYDANEFTQTRDGLRVEMQGAPMIVTNGNALPDVFQQTAVACDPYGRPMVGSGGPQVVNTTGSDGKPKQVMQVPLLQIPAQTESVRLLRPGMWVQKITIGNQTSHVLRLDTAVVRLFDPAGTQYTPIGLDELRADLLASRPCVTSQMLAANLTGIPLMSRNVEIVPKTTFTGYLVFNPGHPMPGIWKVTLYELPVATNPAGQVTKTTQFEIRSVLKHYAATYEVEFGKPPRLVSRQEVQ